MLSRRPQNATKNTWEFQFNMQLQKQVCRSPVRAARPSRVRAPRVVRVRSAEDSTTTEKAAEPQLSFQPNRQAESAYVDFDTAGQANMYPVLTKAYEVGSSEDTAAAGGANLAIGLGAGIVAVGAIVAGLAVLGDSGSPVVEAPAADLKTLSQYAQMFSAEL